MILLVFSAFIGALVTVGALADFGIAASLAGAPFGASLAAALTGVFLACRRDANDEAARHDEPGLDLDALHDQLVHSLRSVAAQAEPAERPAPARGRDARA